jgi:Rrf2 family protein
MLSRKCQYALHALLHIASNRDRIIRVAEITEAKSIPKKFLEAILLDLTKNGILISRKGKNGGYRLNKSPETISVIEVVRLIDGAVALLPCVSIHFYHSCGMCENEETCEIRLLFAKVRDRTIQILTDTHLSDMIGIKAVRIEDLQQIPVKTGDRL